jgi:hypothetical protein
VDIAYGVDEAIIAKHGREWVDNHIDKSIALSNQTFALAGLDYERVVKTVIEIGENHPVSIAAAGSLGARAGLDEMCEHLEPGLFQYFDNVVWLVPISGNTGIVGNAGFCLDSAQRVAVVSMGNNNNYSELLAHEVGHMDGMGHYYGDLYYAETGEATLMSSYSYRGVGSKLLVAGEIVEMQTAHDNKYFWPYYFDQNAPSAPDGIGTVNLSPEDTTFDIDTGKVTFTLMLDEPLNEDVSIEFYTRGIEAKPGIDYVEKINRITFYAGETKKEVSVSMIKSAKRTETKSFDIGVRYGDLVNAFDSMNIELVANAESSEGGSNGGSLGGGTLLLMLLGLGYRRLKL